METQKIKTILEKLSKEDREFCIKEICEAIKNVAWDNYMNPNREGRDENLATLVATVAYLAKPIIK